MNDASEQEKYFELIRCRYDSLSRTHENTIEDLEDLLSDLSVSREIPKESIHDLDGLRNTPNKLTIGSSRPRQKQDQKAILFSAMRKIREALVAARRYDTFAKDVYLFIIRAAIRTATFESYYPAISYLLGVIQLKAALLSQQEYLEVAGYRVLDTACRQCDLQTAYAQERRLPRGDTAVKGVLQSVLQGNWVSFWRETSNLTTLQRCLVRPAAERMRKHAIACISGVYFTVKHEFVERALETSWVRLTDDFSVRWQSDGQNVIVRKQKTQ